MEGGMDDDEDNFYGMSITMGMAIAAAATIA